MDIERTIDFLLKQGAKTDSRLTAVTKLVQQGMRMLVRTETTVHKVETTVHRLAEAGRRTEVRLDRLAEAQRRTELRLDQLAQGVKGLTKAQKETDRTLRAFIRAQRNGRNGH